VCAAPAARDAAQRAEVGAPNAADRDTPQPGESLVTRAPERAAPALKGAGAFLDAARSWVQARRRGPTPRGLLSPRKGAALRT
jgi:hypothetical protein